MLVYQRVHIHMMTFLCSLRQNSAKIYQVPGDATDFGVAAALRPGGDWKGGFFRGLRDPLSEPGSDGWYINHVLFC